MSKISRILVIVTFLLLVANNNFAMDTDEDSDFNLDSPGAASKNQEQLRIRKIYVEGNQSVTNRAILEKIPFRVGDNFDRKKTGSAIRSLYRLGNFKHVQIIIDTIEPGVIDLIVVLTEKDRISNITFTGNSAVATDKIKTEIDASHIKTLDEEELNNIAQKIKRLYQEKGYHHVTIQSSLQPDDHGTFSAHFTINEGYRSVVKKVDFKGNCAIADRYLREKLFTREDWLLGFLDRSGMYHPDAIARDKYVIEDTYQSNGFLNARVTDIETTESEDGCIDITFVINEGDLYTLSSVCAPGNEVLSEEQILRTIVMRPGQLYSKELIRNTMEQLRMLWGQFGYIYADVQPSIRPDEKTKTVAVTFNTDLGSTIAVNRINIVGNRKTRDYVIRREILFNEGDILTTWLMDESKRRVELLGFFDQKDGVNWKIIKIDEDTADLDLVLEEIKTGRVQVKMGFGPGSQDTITDTSERFSVNLELFDTNYRGSGIMYNFSGSYSRQDKVFNASIGNRWLFGRPLYGGGEFHVRSTTYQDFSLTVIPPVEKTIGGSLTLGMRVEQLGYAEAGLAGGFEKIRYDLPIQVARQVSNNPETQLAIQQTVNRSFQPGDLAWVSGSLSQDARNHPIYPTAGYIWAVDGKFGLPYTPHCFGFAKLQFNGDWYTPLVQQYGLALHIRTFLGLIHILDNQNAPYREMYHIGGPVTVRGFKYGQIGPQLEAGTSFSSSLGATKAFTFSAELQFPITEDYNMRGVLFYDGGAGWDTPDALAIPVGYLRNNNFDFRHAIGFGIRLTSPTPLCLDWGFKLDPRKRRGESLSEIHITASQTF